jgi:photosystem II stability/assembly factor-like uncharacterized protein
VSLGGPVYISTNGGITWTSSSPTNYNTTFMRWHVAMSANGGTLVAAPVGSQPFTGGSVYVSTNAGTSWMTTATPTQYWSAVAASADGSKLVATAYSDAAGCGGPIYTSSDSGATWTSNSVPNTNWVSLASSADGSKLVAVAKGITPYGEGPIYTGIAIPFLNIKHSDTNIIVTWPATTAATAFGLQMNAELSTTNWSAAGLPLNNDGTNNSVMLSTPFSNVFFRLLHP